VFVRVGRQLPEKKFLSEVARRSAGDTDVLITAREMAYTTRDLVLPAWT
jgi:hypothetical protein